MAHKLFFFLEIFAAVDSGEAYDTVQYLYLDFSKALDRTPHEKLIRKAEAHGIGGDVIRWVRESQWMKKQLIIGLYDPPSVRVKMINQVFYVISQFFRDEFLKCHSIPLT